MSRASGRYCAAVASMAAWLCLAGNFTALGQAPAPLLYRRVLVPEAELASQIRGLLPMKREEFERRLAELRPPGGTSGRPPLARISQATYRARLEGRSLVAGRAELVVQAADEQPTFLPLEPCSVAIRSAMWRLPARRPAVIGVDPEGKLQCLVEGSGTLELEWACPAVSDGDDDGAARFAFQLLPAPRRTLQIAAPADIELTTETGVVRAEEAAEDGQRVWTIELAGSSEMRLAARPRQAASGSASVVTVRETSKYTVLRSTIDVEATLALDVLQGAPQTLELLCDSSLEVTEVRLAGEALPFIAQADVQADEGQPRTALRLALPEPVRGLSRELVVSASGQWPTPERFELPRIALRGALYQEGQIEVAAPGWLRLDAEAVRGCVTQLISPGSAGRAMERMTFQVFEGEWSIAIRAEPMPAPLREESGTQIVVEASQVSGVMVAELTSLSEARFDLEARIPRHWIVDAVETEPAEMLADRFLDARGTGPQHLRMRFSRPIASGQPLRLILRAHFRRPANGQPLGESLFRLATFGDVRAARRLATIRVSDPAAELRLSGDEGLERVPPAELSPADQRLFESPPATTIYVAEHAGDRLAATLESTTARYRADMTVRTNYRPGGSLHTATIHCQPAVAAVSQMLLRLSPRPRGAVTWRLPGDEERELPAVIETGPAATSSADEIMYRLVLPRPQSLPFEIVGQWQSPADAGDVSLVWAPEAMAQSGVVEVYSQVANLGISATDMHPLPLAASADRAAFDLRARFRYASGRRTRLTVTPRHYRGGPQGAWVEQMAVTSWFSPDGWAIHEAALTVGNAGVHSIRLWLPAAAEDIELAGGDARLSLETNDRLETLVQLGLTSQERRSTIVLRYASRGAALGWRLQGTFSAPLPQTDLPVLKRQWVVALPPELAPRGEWFAAVDSAGDASATAPPAADQTTPSRGAASAGAAMPALVHWLSGPAVAARWWAAVGSPFEPIDSSTADADASFHGWSLWRARLPIGGEARADVYRPAVARAWASCLLLLVSSLTWRFASGRHWPWPAALLALSAAFAFPAPLAGFIAAGAGGLAMGGILGLLWPRGQQASSAEAQPENPSTVRSAAASAGALAVCLMLAADLRAAPTGDGGEVPQRTLRVIVPVNERNEPAGDYVYLEPELYEALHRLAGGSGLKPAWLLQSSRHELAGFVPAAAGQRPVGELRSSFGFHTFEPNQTVRLPFQRSGVLLLANQARLDGEPASLTWQADGNALLVFVARAGKHQLELALGAAARLERGKTTLDVAVPPAAMCSVTWPQAPPQSEIESSVVPAGGAALLSAGADRVAARWDPPQDVPGAAGVFEAEQLAWWRIRPGSVVLQARFQVRPLASPLAEVVIEADPRLRLLPGLTGGPLSHVSVAEGTTNLVRVKLDPSASEPVIRLSWLWADATGVGRLALPRVAIRAARTTRDWTAVTLEGGLALASSDAHDVVTAAEFVQAWGDAAAVPTAVVSNGAEDSGVRGQPSIDVQPSELQPAAELSSQWSFSGTLAVANLRLRLTGVPATRWTHRLIMPPQVKVKHVTLIQGTRPAAHRWHQARDGLLTITLLEAPATEQNLSLVAELPLLRTSGPLTVPQIEPQRVTLQSVQLSLYRQQDVLASLKSATDWTHPPGTAAGAFRAGHGRLIAALQSTGGALPKSPIVELSANKPRVSGRLIARAVEADGDWRGEIHLDVQVTGGVLDEIRLALADRWAGALELDPPMAHHSQALAGESRRLLVIQPEQAVTGRFALSLRGTLLAANGGLQVPEVAALGHPQIERLVWLDRELGGERIEWQTTGLAAAPLSAAGRLAEEWRAAGGDLYRVTSSRYDATALLERSGQSVPRLRLADIRLAANQARHIIATADFTLLPEESGDLTLSLPPGTRLVQTLVDGCSVPAVPCGLRCWTIAAPQHWLPYRLTVLYDMALPFDARAIVVAAPQLAGLRPEQTVWSLEASPKWTDEARIDPAPEKGSSIAASAARLSSAAVHDAAALCRLEAALDALEEILAAPAASIPGDDAAASAARWQAVAEALMDRRAGRQPAPLVPAEPSAGWQQASERLARLKQRLASALTTAGRSESAAPVARVESEAPLAVFAVPGNVDRVQLQLPPAARPVATWRGTWGLGLAAAALLIALVGCRPNAGEWTQQHRGWFCAAAGLGWWLLAPLGWLGWLAVATGLRLAWSSPAR